MSNKFGGLDTIHQQFRLRKLKVPDRHIVVGKDKMELAWKGWKKFGIVVVYPDCQYSLFLEFEQVASA